MPALAFDQYHGRHAQIANRTRSAAAPDGSRPTQWVSRAPPCAGALAAGDPQSADNNTDEPRLPFTGIGRQGLEAPRFAAAWRRFRLVQIWPVRRGWVGRLWWWMAGEGGVGGREWKLCWGWEGLVDVENEKSGRVRSMGVTWKCGVSGRGGGGAACAHHSSPPVGPVALQSICLGGCRCHRRRCTVGFRCSPAQPQTR